jgi:hypothetical protein
MSEDVHGNNAIGILPIKLSADISASTLEITQHP